MKAVSREEILKINPFFTNFIINLQSIIPKPVLWEEGDETYYGIDLKLTKLTKKQAKEMNIQEQKDYLGRLDDNPYKDYISPKFIEHRKIISPEYEYADYMVDLANTLEQIRIALNQKYILFLHTEKEYWLKEEHDLKSVIESQNFIKKFAPIDFDGGFLLNENSTQDMFLHITNVSHAFMSLRDLWISFNSSNTAIHICQYDVMHFEFYNAKEMNIILNLLKNKKFYQISSCNNPYENGDVDRSEIIF